MNLESGVYDFADYLQLQGLFVGSAFSPEASASPGRNASISGIVPTDGILVVGILSGEGGGPYTVSSLNTVPEPST